MANFGAYWHSLNECKQQLPGADSRDADAKHNRSMHSNVLARRPYCKSVVSAFRATQPRAVYHMPLYLTQHSNITLMIPLCSVHCFNLLLPLLSLFSSERVAQQCVAHGVFTARLLLTLLVCVQYTW